MVDTQRNDDEVLINENIQAKQVRLIDANNENRGIVSIQEALAIAEEEGLDYGGVGPLNKRLNNFGGNYYKNCNNEKYKYKDYMYLGLKETEEEIYGNLDEDKDLF